MKFVMRERIGFLVKLTIFNPKSERSFLENPNHDLRTETVI